MIKRTILSTFVLCALSASLVFAQEIPDHNHGEETPDSLNEIPEEGSQKFDPAVQRTFYICGTNHHMDLNPHTSSFSNEAQIINGLQEGLFSYDPKSLEPVPALAETYKISRDKKRWTFTMREGAAFSDGKPITAQTIIDSWLLMQKTPNAPYASLLDCIQGIKDYREGKIAADKVGLKVSGKKLIVLLNTPTAHLPRLLCHHSFSAFTGDMNVFSGAFKIAEFNSKELTLVKNDRYWDSKNVALSEIKITLSDDEKENTWLFNTGRTDWVMYSIDSDKLINKNSIKISAIFGTSYLFFTCRNQYWNDANFRNALITAIPWEKLRAGNLIQATTLVYPLTGYPQVEGLTEGNEDEAVELMNEAREKASIPKDKVLDITFGITDGDYMLEMAKILKEAWAPLGVNLVTFKIREEDYLTAIPYLNYDIFSYSWIGDFADPLAFLELFREGSTLNQTGWKNPKFTELLNQADTTTDAAERYKLLSRAEQVLIDDGVVMPIRHSVSLHAINLKAVGGWYTNALDIHPLKYIFFKDYTQSDAPNVVAGPDLNVSPSYSAGFASFSR